MTTATLAPSLPANAFIGMPEWAKQCPSRYHAYSSYADGSMEKVQLDNAIRLDDNTADYLYNAYSPTEVNYVPGSRPLLEKIVGTVCANCRTPLEKAQALVTWRRANYRHVGKCGLGTEEEILLGGYSMCHDASRVLIILCQVAGVSSRMVIGLNNDVPSGHTYTEVFVDGRWAIFDPSPTMPYRWLEGADGTLLNCRDLQLDPEAALACPVHQPGSVDPLQFAGYQRHCHLVNYTLEESNAYMAQRFVRLITAQKIVENYDYQGHLDQTRLAAFADLDKTVDAWLADTTAKGND